MRRALLVLFITGFSTIVSAQKNGSVSGTAFDTISKQPVSAATITVLNSKDSSLVTFTMTGNDGRFNLTGLAEGSYRLLITHVNYHNSNTWFLITDSIRSITLGNVIMNDKAKVLEEVVIANEAPPITLINDTIQYNAGSFKVQPNANVEELLKKLPGVKVEKDGTIKAQGETVNRVLVDGKEFFGNDPKVATKNLPADAVDKVQVYDKQSDQAQLTGFDDGNYEKTINLKLKKDKKKGVFGKVNAGAGNKERYEGKFNVNSFKGARQFSAIGMGNNTNAEGFSFMDILNFTGELARMQKGGGGNIDINISSDDAAALGINPGGRNSGITTAWGGGLNYNNIIGTKLDMQSNYFYNRFNPKQESHIQRQYFLPDSFYFYNQDAYSDNLNNSHRLNLNLLFEIDSMNSIRFQPSLNLQKTNNRSQSNYQTLSQNKMLAIDGFSNTQNLNNGYNFKNEITWRKKFARKGRTFSMSLQTSLNESDGNGNLSSVNSFYDPNGVLTKKDTLNQKSSTSGDLKSYNIRAAYTEPIWKRSLLELSIRNSNSKSISEKTTYDYNSGNGKYDQLNDMLSNDFENTYGFTNLGLRTRTQRKKYSYSVGFYWQYASLKGKIISEVKDSVLEKSFSNILPTASFQYNFTRFKRFSVFYNTSTNQPSASQLQPVPDISNPLNIKNGNPDLKQEFTHSIRGNLNLISPYKNKNLFWFFNIQTTRNKIVNYDSLDLGTGIRYSRPVNVDGVFSMNNEVSYSMPVRFLKGSVELSTNIRYNKGKQFISQVANDIKTVAVGPELRLDMNPTQKLNIGTGVAINYNKSKYSIQSALSADYLSQEFNASLDWEMPKGFFFSTDFVYTINSQRAAGFNTRVPLWNASISKQMLKFNRGELKLSARDILNRNIGISRNTNNNYIEDSRVLTLRQFFMLSFTYSLSKLGLNNGSGGGMKIITR
ncbi:MAG TPA: outer membrane beta-barrel family protein [Chitinophagaceae bacterium]|nr:outer membrane beta-barrel family protein [Chitinophagaceae bacterium]